MDPALLWLWLWLAATAMIRPLPWEPPYTTGVPLKRQKGQKKKNHRVTETVLPYKIFAYLHMKTDTKNDFY